MSEKAPSKSFKNLAPAELEQKLQDLRKELFDLRYKKTTGQLDKPHQFKATRKQIAQILTIQSEAKHAKS